MTLYALQTALIAAWSCMGGTLLHPVLGEPVRKVLQAGTEKQEKAARPWAAHPATASSNWDCFGIAPWARGERYRLRFQG